MEVYFVEGVLIGSVLGNRTRSLATALIQPSAYRAPIVDSQEVGAPEVISSIEVFSASVQGTALRPKNDQHQFFLEGDNERMKGAIHACYRVGHCFVRRILHDVSRHSPLILEI